MTRTRLRMLLVGSLVGSLAWVSAPLTAVAEPASNPSSSAERRQLAKQYVEAGLAAQTAGDYDTAVTLYQKAYDVVPHPVLLFNMAQAHRLAGRTDQSLALYRRYVREDPSGAQVKTARSWIAELEVRQAQEQEARRADEARRAEDARRAEAARPPVVASPPGATSPQRADDTASSSGGASLRVAGIVSGAVGVIGLGVGTGFALHARSLSSELSRSGAQYDPEKVHAGQRADTIAIVGFAAGGALVVAGAALYWWGRQDHSVERVGVAPVVSSQSAGLAVFGAW